MGTFPQEGQDFPHLYRELLMADIEWHTNLKKKNGHIRCPRVLMKLSEKIALQLLSNFDPEIAHNLAIKALKFGVIPSTPRFSRKNFGT